MLVGWELCGGIRRGRKLNKTHLKESRWDNVGKVNHTELQPSMPAVQPAGDTLKRSGLRRVQGFNRGKAFTSPGHVTKITTMINSSFPKKLKRAVW